MAGEHTLSTLNPNFKEVYAKLPKFPIPRRSYLMDKFELLKGQQMPGNKYHQMVMLSMEGGYTYGGNTGLAFDLNTAVPAEFGDAQIEPAEIIGSHRVSKGAITRAMGSKASWMKTAQLLTKVALLGAYKRGEISMLYGRQGIGEVLNTTGTSGTTLVMQLTEASWSTGIWFGMKGTRLDVYSAQASGTQRTNSATECIVTAVDIANRKITCSADSGDAGDVAQGDFIYFKGSYSTADMAGIDLQATTTGDLHNINAATYPDTAKGVSFAVDGLLTIGELLDANAELASRGREGDCVALVPHKAYAKLNAAESSLRQYDGSYSKKRAKNGSESIEFSTEVGIMEIVPHAYVKDGEAFLLPMDEMVRIGTGDPTVEDPANEGEFFHRIEGKNAYEFRSFQEWAGFCETRAHLGKLTGIAYTA